MIWQTPMILDVVLHDAIAPVLMKKRVSAASRTLNILIMFTLTATLAVTTGFLVMGARLWHPKMPLIFALGICNAAAVYCRWEAVNISLSKTSLFTWGDDLIALGLGYTVLGEGKLLNPLLGLGLGLALSSVVTNSTLSARTAKRESVRGNKFGLFGWIAGYSIVWGVANFSIRYLAADGMPPWSYLTAWYLGSVAGASTLLFLNRKKEPLALPTKEQILSTTPLALVVWGSLLTNYWLRTLAPLTVTQPIYQVSEMVLPTAIGLWFFKEARTLRRIDWLVFLMGMVGAGLVAASF